MSIATFVGNLLILNEVVYRDDLTYRDVVDSVFVSLLSNLVLH